MTRVKCTGLALAFGVAVMFSGPAPATARSAFDGIWSVVIVTEVGTCERAYRHPVQIVNGIVRLPPGDAEASVNIAGRVDQRGVARVTVSRGDQLAHGVGRLSTRSGSGTWTSQTARCSGRWIAERRGVG
jgi:hypothetical protein